MDKSATVLEQILTTLTIVSIIVAAATAYLRLFVKNTASEIKESVGKSIDEAFVRKAEVVELRRRLEVLEERAERRDEAEANIRRRSGGG
jgi:hypothetical protein